MKKMPEENDGRLSFMQGRLQEQIAFVHRNFGKSEKKKTRPAKLAMLSLEVSLTHNERLTLLQSGKGANLAGMPMIWKNDIMGILAARFAELQALPAKITAAGRTQGRLSVLRFGRLADQLAAVFLLPPTRLPAKSGGDLPKLEANPVAAEALPPSESSFEEHIKALPAAEDAALTEKVTAEVQPTKPEDASAHLPALEAPIEELPAELWRYEIALGRDFVKNCFLNEDGAVPDMPYSIPAFFPTHQWINIVLDDGQWLDDAADGEWKHKKIATRPVDL